MLELGGAWLVLDRVARARPCFVQIYVSDPSELLKPRSSQRGGQRGEASQPPRTKWGRRSDAAAAECRGGGRRGGVR
jgi:hypothetical protein